MINSNLDKINWCVSCYPNIVGKEKKLVGEYILYNRWVSRKDLGIEPIVMIRLPIICSSKKENIKQLKKIFDKVKKMWKEIK